MNNIKKMYNNVKCTPKRISMSMLGKPYLLAKTSLRTTDWGKDFCFLDELPKEQPNVSIKTLNKDIYQVPNVFHQEQCKEMIDKANVLNLQFCCYDNKRSNSRLVLFDEAFANHLWDVISKPLKDILGDQKIQPFGFDVVRGEWNLSGVNEAMRLNRYSGKHKEHFGLHRDAPFCPNGDRRSLYTVLIYLNDDFRGGETIFYTPKDTMINTKGCNVKEEIAKHRSLTSGYDSFTYIPKAGDVVIFKQNLLHEGVKLRKQKNNESFKYIIKTDIMVERPADSKLGFAPSPSEEKDFFECLQLFRKAQQYELIEDNTKANDCYERSLSYRYSYPDHLDDQIIGENENSSMIIDIENNQIESTKYSCKDFTVKEHNPFSIFSHEIWYRIICFLQNDKSLRSLCEVFPSLRSEMKRVLFGKINPNVDHHSGIFHLRMENLSIQIWNSVLKQQLFIQCFFLGIHLLIPITWSAMTKRQEKPQL